MTTLDQILAATRERVERSKAQLQMHSLEKAAAAHTPRGFRKRLVAMSQLGPAVIAELKKASPSKGTIRGTFPVAMLANQLARGGASALSVLTDEEFFQGSLANLLEASAATNLPCLRKDFIIDEFQITEARAHRADAILLILSALDDATFRRLLDYARVLDLDALCEVHDDEELKRAIEGGADIIGVNSRDLETLVIDPAVTSHLIPMIPADRLAIAESGVRIRFDVERAAVAGADAVLVGSAVSASSDPTAAVAALTGVARMLRGG